jgi:ferritin-like metal-binding protein YciE
MARQPTKKSTKRSAKPAARRTSKRTAKKSPRGGSRGSIARKGTRGSSARQQQTSKSLTDLFLETLKDIYHAEKQILKALPKMAKAANSNELRAAFEKHVAETEDQVGRVEQIFELIGEKAKAKPCHAIMGLVEEGQEVMQEFKGSQALDAGLLAGAQAVEHYEISRYGTLKAWAEELGLNQAVQLIDATLTEEKNTDQALTGLAESRVNREAETGGGRISGGSEGNEDYEEAA